VIAQKSEKSEKNPKTENSRPQARRAKGKVIGI
jgi:hypothetical protein